MKNLTNLYVYDGNELPKFTLDETNPGNLQSVENVPINVLLYGKTTPVSTILQATESDGSITYGNIIYILAPGDNTKTLSIEKGENGFKFFIKTYAYAGPGINLNGNVVVKSFKMAGFGDAPIPFGQSFYKDSNSNIVSDEMGLQLGALYECICRYISLQGADPQLVIVARRIGGYEKLSTTFSDTSIEGKGFYVPYIGDGMYVLNVKKQTNSNVTYEQFSTFITKNVFPEGVSGYQSSIGDFAKALIDSPYLNSTSIDKFISVLRAPETNDYTIWCASATYIPL